MCGRAAQSRQAIVAAGQAFDAVDLVDAALEQPRSSFEQGGSSTTEEVSNEATWDNYNMSPGMDAFVIYKDNGKVSVSRKTWGIISRGGTTSSPLAQGMGKHFDGLMFNARSDTLYTKPTFSRLANAGKSCIVAVDGYFEWKSELQQKVPYFVTDDSKRFLLLAGLWNRVSTGWGDKPYLDTFTLLTTEANNDIRWLHSRMPVPVNAQLARQWIESPTPHNQETLISNTKSLVFLSYRVTPKMTSLKFRSQDAIAALPKMKTIQSMFASHTKKRKSDSKHTDGSAEIQSAPTSTPITSTPKRPKVMSKPKQPSAASFFKPKTPSTR